MLINTSFLANGQKKVKGFIRLKVPQFFFFLHRKKQKQPNLGARDFGTKDETWLLPGRGFKTLRDGSQDDERSTRGHL